MLEGVLDPLELINALYEAFTPEVEQNATDNMTLFDEDRFQARA